MIQYLTGQKIDFRNTRLEDRLCIYDWVIVDQGRVTYKSKKIHNCPFKTLEIPNTANKSEIKQAYIKLAKEYHPDKLSHCLGLEKYATDRFQRIQNAYETIC